MDGGIVVLVYGRHSRNYCRNVHAARKKRRSDFHPGANCLNNVDQLCDESPLHLRKIFSKNNQYEAKKESCEKNFIHDLVGKLDFFCFTTKVNE